MSDEAKGFAQSALMALQVEELQMRNEGQLHVMLSCESRLHYQLACLPACLPGWCAWYACMRACKDWNDLKRGVVVLCSQINGIHRCVALVVVYFLERPCVSVLFQPR